MEICENKNGTIRVIGKCSLADAMGGIAKRFLAAASVHQRVVQVAEQTGDRIGRAAAEQRLQTALRRGSAFVKAAAAVPASRRTEREVWDLRSETTIGDAP